MRRFLRQLAAPVFIFVLFTSFPFSKIFANYYLIDEYGRIVLMGPRGEVLGDQFMGGGQPPGDNRSQQPNTQSPSRPSETQGTSRQQSFEASFETQGKQVKPLPQQQMMQQRPQEQSQQRPLPQQNQQFQGKPSLTGQSFEGQDKPAESTAETEKNLQEMMRENGKQDQEFSREMGKQNQEAVREAGKQQQEVNRETEKNKREMMRIGVQNGELRIQSRQEGGGGGFGQMGQQVESVRIRQSAKNDEVEIRATGNEIEMNQNNIRTRTRFPLSVNDKNEITVTTPKGTQTVTVLPEEAVKEAFRRGAMTSFGSMGQPGKQIESGGNGDKDEIQQNNTQQVELVDENGQLEYKVDGLKEAKLFGFFPVSSSVETRISAETGAVTSVSQPWFFSNFGFLFR